MRNFLCAVIVGLSTMSVAGSAIACLEMADRELDDIKYANIVVIGRVVNYSIVRDEAFRKRYIEGFKRSADKSSPYWAEDYARATSKTERFLSDYARFTVLVDEVLVGKPSKSITVTWDNSTFGEPEAMKEGPYLIALRVPASSSPPLRGPSATVLPSLEQSSLTVLQAPCAPAFILDASSAEVKTIRDMLTRPPKNQQENQKKMGQHD